MEILSNIGSFIYNIIIFGIVFGISYSINVFYLFNGLVSLLWLPYVSYKILKKDLNPRAIWNCIIAPIVWNILFMILGFISVKFAPIGKIINIFFLSIAGILGGIFALIQVFINMFSAQAREEFLSGIKNVW